MDGSIHVVRNRIAVAEGWVGELKREHWGITGGARPGDMDASAGSRVFWNVHGDCGHQGYKNRKQAEYQAHFWSSVVTLGENEGQNGRGETVERG